jgi:hypothetical protein
MSRLIHARSLRNKDLTAKWAVSAEFQLSKTGCFWSNIIVCYESSLVDGVKSKKKAHSEFECALVEGVK